jgi:uncharacterized membrane protein
MASVAHPKPTAEACAAGTVRADSAGLVLIAAVLLAACGHLMIKYGLNAAPASPGQGLQNRVLGYLLSPGVLLGLSVYGAGTLLWIVAVSKQDISYLFPISAVNYVLLTIAGTWLFHEPVSPLRWVGIVVVMIGVALLQTTARKGKS